MRYTLMHKNTPVTELELDATTKAIRKVGVVYNPEQLPVGVAVRDGVLDRLALNEWWESRTIPEYRPHIEESLRDLHIQNRQELAVRSYGLSLSDQFWVCPGWKELEWDNINFFRNNFSEDVGDVLFGEGEKKWGFDYLSPDSTTDGFLVKRWQIEDGKRVLLKGGSKPYQQQPFCEVIAMEVANRLSIPHIPYSLTWIDDLPFSVCEDFVTEDTELVPAWLIMQTQKKNNSTSTYQHFVNCCGALGIKSVVSFLDQMIVLDYIIANEDRHYSNFGAIRDANTLEWLGMAPIYDSGTSLGYDRPATAMNSIKWVQCKPFKTHHNDQLKLVSSFSWLDLSKLSDIEDVVFSVFSDERANKLVGRDRERAIARAMRERIEHVARAAENHDGARVDEAKDDADRVVPENYVRS